MMARNVEIKARLADLPLTEKRVIELADQGPFDLTQDDTFFKCPSGRLKLRELAPDRGEVIYYNRPDLSGPKLSEYSIAPTSSPEAMRHALSQALPVIGRIRKTRRLYLTGNTRIHLDRVEKLGTFLELEVVLSDSQSPADGEKIARQILKALGIPETDLIEGAYIDLL